MKKKKITPIQVIVIVLLAFVPLVVGLLTKDQRKKTYEQGYLDGRASVTLDEVCVGKKWAGVSANFETGEYFEWVKCKTNFKNNIRVQDVFEPEGDWDYCKDLNDDGDFDDEGECKPAARDSEWVD